MKHYTLIIDNKAISLDESQMADIARYYKIELLIEYLEEVPEVKDTFSQTLYHDQLKELALAVINCEDKVGCSESETIDVVLKDEDIISRVKAAKINDSDADFYKQAISLISDYYKEEFDDPTPDGDFGENGHGPDFGLAYTTLLYDDVEVGGIDVSVDIEKREVVYRIDSTVAKVEKYSDGDLLAFLGSMSFDSLVAWEDEYEPFISKAS